MPKHVTVEAHSSQHEQRPDSTVRERQRHTGDERRAHKGEALEGFD
jgi:hypothetical protein